MAEEHKSTQTPARAKSIQKYLSDYEDIKIRVPKGQREHYNRLAANAGESLNSFALRAMEYLAKIEGLDK